MNGLVPSGPTEQTSDLERVRQLVTRATVQFPISQLLVPLANTFDLLLDDVATERNWVEAFSSYRDKFGPQWEVIAARALSQDARQTSDQALKNPNYDPLVGIVPWGVELTHAFRATLSEVEQFGNEMEDVFPTDKRTRAFARALKTQTGRFVLPVLSYVALQESEWRVIIDMLNQLIELALLFEGAVIVWLIGGFARDPERRLVLRPQLSVSPPPSGTRVKPLRVLLGTAYEEQCPSLIQLVQAMDEAQSRRSDSLLTAHPWHRLVVQLDATVDDYVLMNIDLLSQTERELARRVVQLDRQPRQPHVLRGTVNWVTRPWGWDESIGASSQAPEPHPASDVSPRTTVLPPRPPMQAMSYDTGPLEPLPATGGVGQDAEELRRKGMAAIKTDPAVAQRYLLASTMLENTSVDVWLTLVDIAKNEKQKESFRREAEKVLRRQHGKT